MKTLTILVAEDDLLSRMVLERSVVQWGYQMVSASDGETALGLLQTRNIDVCLLDWDMPKMTGVQVCKWLRTSTLNSEAYVVLITGREQPEDIQAGYEAGADDYLTKPCDLKYLRRRMTSVAEKLARQEALLEEQKRVETVSVAGLSPLEIYLSEARLARRKS
jgi:DNA-binding response OmpR family regulator